MFNRSFLLDISATVVGWLLGSVVAVAVELASLLAHSPNGLGAVSAGLTDGVLYAIPIAVLLAVAAQWARRRMSRGTFVPFVLGGLGALLGALWVMSSLSVSAG
jgi:predicted transporter